MQRNHNNNTTSPLIVLWRRLALSLDPLKQRPEGADRASRRYYKSQRKEGSRPDSQLSLFSDPNTISGS